MVDVLVTCCSLSWGYPETGRAARMRENLDGLGRVARLRVCWGVSDAFGGSGFPPGLGAEGAAVPAHRKPFATRPWRKYAPS